MHEFDPRHVKVRRLAPRFLIGLFGLLGLLAGWRLTSGDTAPAAPLLDPAALAALQQTAFAEAETRPGFTRAQNITVEVLRGETLEAAVRRTGVAPDEARIAVGLMARAFDTVNIRAGMTFDAAIARPRDHMGPARLIGLSLRTGPATAITLSRTFDGALRLRELEEKVTAETTVAQGAIHGSLYESAKAAGADGAIVAKVVELFAHKLDFDRDIKAGDRFSMVFDRRVTESGRTVDTGDLLYAEIEANGATTRFYSFDHDGRRDYYDEDGKNIRGFLLRTPVDGARMTSTFGMRRHPILGYNRMHQGIDFGAGTGTPVVAAGDGVVVEARRWGGYGNWLRIRHANGWETGYGHLSRYATGLRPGMRVTQGQVVAYVGSTGASTGPHLHYEVWLKGARVNPVGVKVPQGSVLAGADLIAFRMQKARIDALIAGASADPQVPRLTAIPAPARTAALRPRQSETPSRGHL